MGDERREIESPLIDVSEIPLTEIGALEGTVLGRALERILDESGAPQASAGFDSGLTDDEDAAPPAPPAPGGGPPDRMGSAGAAIEP